MNKYGDSADDSCALAIQVATKAGLVGMSLGIVLWSLDLVLESGYLRIAGIVGVFAGIRAGRPHAVGRLHRPPRAHDRAGHPDDLVSDHRNRFAPAARLSLKRAVRWRPGNATCEHTLGRTSRAARCCRDDVASGVEPDPRLHPLGPGADARLQRADARGLGRDGIREIALATGVRRGEFVVLVRGRRDEQDALQEGRRARSESWRSCSRRPIS